MTNKTCTTCIDNDNGLCDRKGILIHEDIKPVQPV